MGVSALSLYWVGDVQVYVIYYIYIIALYYYLNYLGIRKCNKL